jgi:2,3-bisphosphoglycerate-independent phosphoglycerate mutase
MNLGAGRVVYQEITRIDKSIREGRFFEIGAFRALCERVRKDGKRLHLLGLVSDGGVHSSDHHLRSLIELARRAGLARDAVVVHAILDGRDTPPRSGAGYVEALEQDLSHAGVGRIGTVVGRYWAMDRDKRWERVQRAYNLLTAGVGTRHTSALEAVHASYAADKGDEFVEPRVIGDPAAATMQDQDGVLCFNFRADRMREIVSALGLADFTGFERKLRPALEIVTMTQYRADLPFAVAYPPVELRGTFGEVLAAHRLRQERIAETEKYAHVTFFFSGGREAEVQGESRTLVPSPKVATYDLKPEMSAVEVTDRLIAAIESHRYATIICNYANADMVGHSGDFDATVRCIEVLDTCLGRLADACAQAGMDMIITSDHGNAEKMCETGPDGDSEPHTAHTSNLVPFIHVGRPAEIVGSGSLIDVAPTMLYLLGLPIPREMTGRPLVRLRASQDSSASRRAAGEA